VSFLFLHNLFSALLMMSSFATSIKETISHVGDNSKKRDLNKETYVPDSSSHMTTDYGAKISDPDNWYVFAL
jgi:hypothetical protein